MLGRKMLVGRMAAFKGSPSHFASVDSLGRAAVTSRTTDTCGWRPVRQRSVFQASHGSRTGRDASGGSTAPRGVSNGAVPVPAPPTAAATAASGVGGSGAAAAVALSAAAAAPAAAAASAEAASGGEDTNMRDDCSAVAPAELRAGSSTMPLALAAGVALASTSMARDDDAVPPAGVAAISGGAACPAGYAVGTFTQKCIRLLACTAWLTCMARLAHSNPGHGAITAGTARPRWVEGQG